MITLGLCTHFTQTDEWAFEYAFRLARARGWQLNICHWLHSPYLFRRDYVQNDLFQPDETLPVNPELLNKLELQLREYYDPRLGDFTNAAFKLCEGQYQVELVRCLRKNLLNLVVMGYQPAGDDQDEVVQSMEGLAHKLPYPLIIVGRDGPEHYLLNLKAMEWLDKLDLKEGTWEIIQREQAEIVS